MNLTMDEALWLSWGLIILCLAGISGVMYLLWKLGQDDDN